VIISIAAVGWGTGAIANDEETGQLELTLARGVTRGQLYAERAAAVVVKLARLGLVAVVMVLALNGPSELGVEVGPLIAATGAFVGLGLLAASASIAVGGITGRRSWSLGAGASVAVYGYTVTALGNQTQDLEWLHNLSPFSSAYGAHPLTDGWDCRIWFVYGVAALFLLAGWLVFRRRDLAI
jgi:ABC-2 type transport system permease protein